MMENEFHLIVSKKKHTRKATIYLLSPFRKNSMNERPKNSIFNLGSLSLFFYLNIEKYNAKSYYDSTITLSYVLCKEDMRKNSRKMFIAIYKCDKKKPSQNLSRRNLWNDLHVIHAKISKRNKKRVNITCSEMRPI